MGQPAGIAWDPAQMNLRPEIPPLLRLQGWQREPRVSKDGKDIDTMFVMCCPEYFTT